MTFPHLTLQEFPPIPEAGNPNPSCRSAAQLQPLTWSHRGLESCWGRGRGDRCHTDCVPRSSNSKGQTRAGGGDEGGEGGGSLGRGQWRRRGCSGGSEGSLDTQGRAGPERGGCPGTRAVRGAFPTLGAATPQSLALFTPPPPRPPCACSLAPAPAQPAPQGLSRSLSCSALGGGTALAGLPLWLSW